MYYSDVITLVSSQVRDTTAWPSNTTKLQDQIDEIFTATLDIARNVPLVEIHATDTTSTLTGAGTPMIEADLPSDLFDGRADLGIKNLEFDSEIRLPIERVSLSTLRYASSNTYQAQNVLFAFDTNKLYCINATTIKITYLPLLTKPTTSNYDSTTFPLSGNNVDAVVASVAAHVLAVQVRDTQEAAVHANFAQSYKGD